MPYANEHKQITLLKMQSIKIGKHTKLVRYGCTKKSINFDYGLHNIHRAMVCFPWQCRYVVLHATLEHGLCIFTTRAYTYKRLYQVRMNYSSILGPYILQKHVLVYMYLIFLFLFYCCVAHYTPFYFLARTMQVNLFSFPSNICIYGY